MAKQKIPDDLMQRRQFELLLIQKAWEDESFRKKLIAQPRETVQKEMKAIDPNASIPKGVTVSVVEESASKITIVLPMKAQARELTEAELAGVAGGVADSDCDGQTVNICIIKFGGGKLKDFGGPRTLA